MSTKESLLDTAEHLARSRGFDAFSYADLAREVGIQKASIHHHFATKADLASTLITRYGTNFMATLGAIAKRKGPPAKHLVAYLDAYEAALDQGRKVCLCVAFSAARDSFDAPVLQALADFHGDSLAWLTDLFARLEEDAPDQHARATLALVEGAQLMARAAGDPSVFRAATQILRHRYD